MLVNVPPTALVIRIWDLYLSFTSGVAFPLHHGGIFALKGSAPSRVYHLAGAYNNLLNQIYSDFMCKTGNGGLY